MPRRSFELTIILFFIRELAGRIQFVFQLHNEEITDLIERTQITEFFRLFKDLMVLDCLLPLIGVHDTPFTIIIRDKFSCQCQSYIKRL